MAVPPSPRAVAPLRSGEHVVVIGAGPAGLTAAYQLAKSSDARITVLEADDMVGGISRTAQYKGFRFDIGGHRFFTKIAPVESSGRRRWKAGLMISSRRGPSASVACGRIAGGRP